MEIHRRLTTKTRLMEKGLLVCLLLIYFWDTLWVVVQGGGVDSSPILHSEKGETGQKHHELKYIALNSVQKVKKIDQEQIYTSPFSIILVFVVSRRWNAIFDCIF